MVSKAILDQDIGVRGVVAYGVVDEAIDGGIADLEGIVTGVGGAGAGRAGGFIEAAGSGEGEEGGVANAVTFDFVCFVRTCS